ncbi:MAG: hypothetical protein IPH50_13325 [Rhodanobacteraceae bacterium]|nr:hypothetical protein [Rhodanobacteraceae bacterium]
MENLLRERWLRDRHPFEELVRQLDSPAVGKALQQWHKDAWVYNAHPVYWQARVYRKFIQDEPPGAYISQVDAARWARNEIGVEFVLGELFLAQYAAMMNARSAGYFKETVSDLVFHPGRKPADSESLRSVRPLVHPTGGRWRHLPRQRRPASIHARTGSMIRPRPTPMVPLQVAAHRLSDSVARSSDSV